MKSNVVKCLPVFALAFGLAACGNSATKHTDGAAPAVSAATINTAFEADCGADAAAASANSAFDLSSCQLSSQQMALLSDVGPFKVEADCVKGTVRIVKKDNAEQVVGDGAIGEAGAFSVPLTIGSRFSELDGCPVTLAGTASGVVTCSEDKKVSNVLVNTEFKFASLESEGGASLAALLDPSHQENGKGGQQVPGKVVTPAPVVKGEQGKVPTPAPTPIVKGQQGKVPTPAPTPIVKGEQGKGGQHQSGGVIAPTQRVSACVKSEPCSFTSKAQLSCSR